VRNERGKASFSRVFSFSDEQKDRRSKTLKQEEVHEFAAILFEMGRISGSLIDDDLDLVIANLGSPVRLLQNHGSENQAIKVCLRGPAPNTRAIGARVEIESGKDGGQVRIGKSTIGFLASSDDALHFGLGSGEGVGERTVLWPDGTKEQFSDLKAGREDRFSAPADLKGKEVGNDRADSLLFESLSGRAGLDFQHCEWVFDDESLNTHPAHSPFPFASFESFGPGIAVCFPGLLSAPAPRLPVLPKMNAKKNRQTRRFPRVSDAEPNHVPLAPIPNP